MNKKLFSNLALVLVVVLGVILVVASYSIHTPFAAWRRRDFFIILLIIEIVLIPFGAWLSRYTRVGKITAYFAIFAVLLLVGREIRFHYHKKTVLRGDPKLVEQLGSHFIVGYHNQDELLQWVELRAIGGVYITRRNLRKHSVSSFSRFIDRLQQIRKKQGLLPLVIAADQEGGIVAHLSPPLPRRPSLARVLRKCSHPKRGQDSDKPGAKNDVLSPACQRAFREYGQSQGQDLRSLGVNLDFAPVVDLKHDQKVRFDVFSRISERAIAEQPETVASAAAYYCAGLAYSGIGCTAKHFPGLGLNKQDAHFFLGSLEVSRSTLETSEWIPFRHLMRFRSLPQAVMVSHIELPCIEPGISSSRSKKLLNGIVRKKWRYRGLLVSDDFSMFPVSEGSGGIGFASVEALRYGMDFVLISYDSDLFYRAISYVVDAYVAGSIKTGTLKASKARIRLFFDRIEKAHQNDNLTPPEL